MKKRKKIPLLDREFPYKVVAAGFNVMRFRDQEGAWDAFNRYRGPGSCLLISYEAGETKILKYKRVK